MTWLPYVEIVLTLLFSVIGAYILHRCLVPIFYRALLSWPVFPCVRNQKVRRSKIQDVYKYMLKHDIPVVNFRETHDIGNSLLESMSRKTCSASFRSYESRMHRFERQIREEVNRNDMICRRSGYVRQSQNRMIVNDMTRIRCTDQLMTEQEGDTQSSSELVSKTITQQISLQDLRILDSTQPVETELAESTTQVTETEEATQQSISHKNSMLAPPIPNQPPRFSAPTGMPDLSMPPPMQQNPSTSGSSGTSSNMQASRDYMQSNNYFMRPAYRFKVPMNNRPEESMMGDGPGRRLRKNVSNVRRHIDYASPLLNQLQNRLWIKDRNDQPRTQPDSLFQCKILPPSAMRDNPVDCVMSRFVRAAMNKVKCPVYATCWTPEGKRLITGASSGEFTLWNGTAFNFETILQAHGSAVRAMQWSHNDQWMISADHEGYVKYWQPNMNNVHMFIAHKDEPIRSLSFSPTDSKIVTGSDDATAKIFDFGRCEEERVLRGHGSDVRSVAWHPRKGLIATGSRDSQQPVKLWDPRSGQCLSTLYGHKNSVMSVEWNRNGNWLLSGSRDHLLKLYDIRMMKEMRTFRAHKKEVTALAWHPVHENLFVSGGGDGSIAYWLANHEKELALLEDAHDQAIWSLKWHPLGHILASGSNDNNTKFWARNRPGDTQEDIFGIAPISSQQASVAAQSSVVTTDENGIPVIPGMGLTDEIYEELRQETNSNATVGFGGALLFPDEINSKSSTAIGAKRTLIKQPPAKKVQRQFERMWNVAKPGMGSGGADEPEEDYDGFRKPKMSLLGRPTSSSMLSRVGPPSNMQMPPPPQRQQGPPPGGPYRGGDIDMRGGPPPPWEERRGPPTNMQMPPPQIQQGPPPSGPYRGDIDMRGGMPPPWEERRGPPTNMQMPPPQRQQGPPPNGPYRGGDIDMRGGPPPPWAGEDRRGRKRGRGGRF